MSLTIGHGLQAAVVGPAEPAGKKLLRRTDVRVVPEPADQGLIEMLSNVEALSVPVRASGEETYDMVAPAMKVREFNFTEVTRF